ncbi:MAG: hypothetical protein ABI947_20770 [Chloroflexota bacterium]
MRIYCSGRDSQNRSRIGFCECDLNDPFGTLTVADVPILTPGAIGNFDDSGVMATWLLDYEGIQYLYYIGWNLGVTTPFRNALGLAVSEDGGTTFNRYADGPILDRSIYDPCFVASCAILIENGLWRMWYLSGVRWTYHERKPRHHYHLKYAESSDGISWRREGRVCIDFANPQEYAISRPTIVKDGNLYRMWYSYRGEAYRIGYAESGDGLSWTRHDQNVGITVSDDGWDAQMIEYPHVFDHADHRYMAYNGNDYGKTGVGLARLRAI